ncbi:MAG: hypothetical protein AVDCRST_MAG38-1735 [uncultured Solirubrobacteraceae bacterium]|uniref:Glycosyltransferase RgtA/B/C/D-like domain-containing protein n=1 Tax=uncultured Solirubrobacteraceae bacterium TaxID=1162706 RepID=A0A6J4RLF6_9ACTN|nr:MAG: hypothetical protein AVDCRST_MAG38-1735 [uncultured Solirubrobacteraceae bacterium]
MMADGLRRPERRVLAGAGALAAGVVVAGIALQAAGVELGTAVAPFVMVFNPQATAWALAAAGLLAAAVALGPRLLATPRSPAALAACLFGAALLLGLAVSAARRGPSGWSHVFELGPGGSFEAKNEYLPGLSALEPGVWFFLDRFAEMVPSMPVNVGGHPPGLMLVIHVFSLDTAERLAALCIASAAACAPLTYLLARNLLGDEVRARLAGVLVVASPVILLYGTTSADAVYAAAGLVAANVLLARRRRWRVLGFFVFALATLGTWALLAIGAWAAIVTWRREGLGPAVVLAAGCGVAVVAVNAVLALAYGYDPIGTLVATEGLYRNSVASVRPYWFWALGSLVAWAVMVGPPITGAWLVATLRARPEALALAAVVLIASVMGFTKAETERIWLPFSVLACLGAASVLPPGRLRPVLAVLALQALGVELLFDTIW